MRLVRLVLAGIAVGAVGGFVAALLRPRSVHRTTLAEARAGHRGGSGTGPGHAEGPGPAVGEAGPAVGEVAPLPEHVEGEPLTELPAPAPTAR